MFIHNIMRAMRGATNHRLIRSKIKIFISHNIDVFEIKQNILIIIYCLKVKNKKNLSYNFCYQVGNKEHRVGAFCGETLKIR